MSSCCLTNNQENKNLYSLQIPIFPVIFKCPNNNNRDVLFKQGCFMKMSMSIIQYAFYLAGSFQKKHTIIY